MEVGTPLTQVGIFMIRTSNELVCRLEFPNTVKPTAEFALKAVSPRHIIIPPSNFKSNFVPRGISVNR